MSKSFKKVVYPVILVVMLLLTSRPITSVITMGLSVSSTTSVVK